MRMSPEKDWGANAGLGSARDFIEGETAAAAKLKTAKVEVGDSQVQRVRFGNLALL